MRNRIIFALTAFVFVCTPVLVQAQVPAAPSSGAAAQGMKNPFPKFKGAPQSRQEQIQRVQARLAVLQKMSDAEWNAWQQEQKRRAAERGRNRGGYQGQPNLGMAPGKNVSPADREKARKNFAQ